MVIITKAEIDKNGRAVKVTTYDEEGDNIGEIVMSADFCHFCIDNLAAEFAIFMEEKGHKIVYNKDIKG